MIGKNQHYLSYFGLLVITLLALYTRWPENPQPYLWLDEAWRAWAILSTNSLSSLIEHMAKGNEVLLLSEWIFGKIGLFLFGKSEVAFRIWPLLFALLGITGAFFFLKRSSASTAAIVAALLISISAGFIYYSREFKPYALDLALSTWALYAAISSTKNKSKSKDIFLFVVLIFFAWFSLVFLFVFPAIVIYRFFYQGRRTFWDFFIIAVPGMLFIALFFLFLKPQNAQGTGLFWARYYPNSLDNIVFLSKVFAQDTKKFLSLNAGIVALFYFIVLPVISHLKKDGMWILLLTPFWVHVVIAYLALYPLFSRPSYYLYGIITIAFAYGLCSLFEFVASRIKVQHQLINIMIVALLIFFLIWTNVIPDNIVRAGSWPKQQGRKAFSELAKRFKKGDVLKYNSGSYFTLLIYKHDVFHRNRSLNEFSFKRSLSVSDRTFESLCKSFLTQKEGISIGDRVWFVSTHVVRSYRNYVNVFSQIGETDVIVRGDRESLVLLKVNKPVAELECD